MTRVASHRLDGLEPDNLLAFLALLGVMRALEAVDEIAEEQKLMPRAGWDLDAPPLRPRLFLAQPLGPDDVVARVDEGIARLLASYVFDGRPDLNYSRAECRDELHRAIASEGPTTRHRLDLLAALMSDGAIKDERTDVIDQTPLCLMFGQGHQHFLERLSSVPRQPAPPPRGRGRRALTLSATQCLAEALFQPWHRRDPTSSFRWDPEEDVRYALMAGDPTNPVYKGGTQHGANRLAAIGLACLTLAPQTRGWRTVASIVGGGRDRRGRFTFAWPVWRGSASLAAIRSLLSHPELRHPGALTYLGVEHVLVTSRFSVGKFMNFGRAQLLSA